VNRSYIFKTPKKDVPRRVRVPIRFKPTRRTGVFAHPQRLVRLDAAGRTLLRRVFRVDRSKQPVSLAVFLALCFVDRDKRRRNPLRVALSLGERFPPIPDRLMSPIDTNSKLLLEGDVYNRCGTDPAAAFLHRLTEKHDVAETVFLVDAGGYLTALSRHGLRGWLHYHDRNYSETWFQTLAIRLTRFHSFWRGSQASATRWLRWFRHYYNRYRPNQALDGRTPAEEVQN